MIGLLCSIPAEDLKDVLRQRRTTMSTEWMHKTDTENGLRLSFAIYLQYFVSVFFLLLIFCAFYCYLINSNMCDFTDKRKAVKTREQGNVE